jgi:thiol-disulfide isomerase/thioredoxin
MERSITFLVVLALAISCKSQPEPFEYTIRGTVIGQDSGQIYMSLSRRVGDRVIINYLNNEFEYKGTTPSMFNSSIMFKPDYSGGSYSIVVEPGEVIIELHVDSIRQKSKVKSGSYNLAFQKAEKELEALYENYDFQSTDFKDKIIEWVKNNSKNYSAVYRLYMREDSQDYFPLDLVGEVLNGIEDPKLKKAREYIKLHSNYRCKKDSINGIGKKAMDFELFNVNKEAVSFQSVAKNKITFVEKSGSWCGNSTRLSRELLPIYEKYKEKGFEIITVVPEFSRDRWEKWIEKEKFPWTNLVELEDDIANSGVSISDLLFRGYGIANYLVDTNGEVIATDISTGDLDEMLMKKFESAAYEEYIKNKWVMPPGIHILDKEEPINSFAELVEKMSGRPFLIDCWATWCSPCFYEFEFNDRLKAFLKTKNMEIVYISFDYPKDESRWIKTIREKNLQGYHFRRNENFAREFNQIGFSGGLPAYLIVNEKGEVVEKNAFRPSDTEKLYSQINEVLR